MLENGTRLHRLWWHHSDKLPTWTLAIWRPVCWKQGHRWHEGGCMICWKAEHLDGRDDG